MDTFFGKPGRVLLCLMDILSFQVWVRFQDFGKGHLIGNKVDDQGNGDPHVANARPPTHEGRIKIP